MPSVVESQQNVKKPAASIFLYPEDRGNRVLQNIDTFLPHYTVSNYIDHSTRHENVKSNMEALVPWGGGGRRCTEEAPGRRLAAQRIKQIKVSSMIVLQYQGPRNNLFQKKLVFRIDIWYIIFFCYFNFVLLLKIRSRVKGGCGLDSSGSGQERAARSCGHYNETLRSIICRGLLEGFSKYQLLKDFALWSLLIQTMDRFLARRRPYWSQCLAPTYQATRRHNPQYRGINSEPNRTQWILVLTQNIAAKSSTLNHYLLFLTHTASDWRLVSGRQAVAWCYGRRGERALRYAVWLPCFPSHSVPFSSHLTTNLSKLRFQEQLNSKQVT